MGNSPQSFEVYGFTIEVHAGGRRVWPPSFKRFINDKMDSGELNVGEVMKTCNVSQTLVYKWRSDVKRAGGEGSPESAAKLFAEIVIDDTPDHSSGPSDDSRVILRGKNVEVLVPAAYPIEDLVTVILSLEERT